MESTSKQCLDYPKLARLVKESENSHGQDKTETTIMPMMMADLIRYDIKYAVKTPPPRIPIHIFDALRQQGSIDIASSELTAGFDIL